MTSFTPSKLTFMVVVYAAMVAGPPIAIAQDSALSLSRGAPRSVSDSPVPVDVLNDDKIAKTSDTDMLEMLDMLDVLEEIFIVGSRGAPRSARDSPVPVDVLNADKMSKASTTDMLELLKGAVPSFNVHDNPISDAASLIRPANLRGLSADSTLILVNGKRRHRASVITFQGGGINDGSQGPDISVIPSIALRRVEVLRDGAAAQYGSDAIAGVINFVLKASAEGGSFEVRQGEYFEGDGQSTQYAGNIGMPLTDNGFVNLSFQYKNIDDTVRSQQVTAATVMTAAGNNHIANPAQIWGNPQIDDDLSIFANAGLELGNDKRAYLFGNYSERDAEGGFYWRNPHTRSNVFSTDGGSSLLIADLDGIGSGVDCPSVNITSNNVLGQADYGIIADNTTAVGANCFAFNEIAPGGYTPRFGGNITDISLTVGTEGIFKGGMLDALEYDISGSVGRNESSFYLNNTFNPSYGPESPRNFKTGKYQQLEKTFNVDLLKTYEVGLAAPLSVAGGYEWREDTFSIFAGERASWQAGDYASQLFAVGSHGFAGFTPESSGSFSRRNYAVYVDIEAQYTPEFMMGYAVRYEDFTTFGNTSNYKITARYQLTDDLAVRGSVGTGFRAPTQGQSNVLNTQTSTSNGELTQVLTLPPVNPVSQILGGTELEPEQSESYAFGVVYEFDDFYLTADYYNITVTDRIGLSDNIAPTAADRAAMTAAGVANVAVIGEVNFFTNDFDTETQGVDIVATYGTELLNGWTDFSFAYNWTETEVIDSSAITGAFKTRRLEEGLPKQRATFTLAQTWEKWGLFVRANYYGDYWAVHVDYDATAKDAGSAVTMDTEVSYQINDNFRMSAGAQNLFDKKAEKLDFDPGLGDWGAQYYETSPYGMNGGLWYMKIAYDF